MFTKEELGLIASMFGAVGDDTITREQSKAIFDKAYAANSPEDYKPLACFDVRYMDDFEIKLTALGVI